MLPFWEMQGAILTTTASASVCVQRVGCVSDMLNFTCRKWGWVLIGLSRFRHSSYFSLQLWFLLYRLSLPAVVVAMGVVMREGFHYPLESEKARRRYFCNVNTVHGQGYVNCHASGCQCRIDTKSGLWGEVGQIILHASQFILLQ